MPGPWVKPAEPLSEGRKGTPWSAGGVREYFRDYLVKMTAVEFADVAACSAPGIPLPYDFYRSGDGEEFDENCILVELSASQDGDEGSWQRYIVHCKYSTELPPGGEPLVPGYPNRKGEDSATNNPELEAPVIKWGFEVVHKAWDRDLLGRPPLNTAGQHWKPAPTFETGYKVLTLTRNEINFDSDKAADYAFAVNEDKFLKYPPGTVQCLPPEADLTWRGKLLYWRVTYKLRFARKYNNPITVHYSDGTIDQNKMYDSWQPEILNQGFMQLERSPSSPNYKKAVNILTAGGTPVTEPQCLDIDGGVSLKVIPAPGKPAEVVPIYCKFMGYRIQKFADLLVRGLG
jgi:hypothetical protein